MADETNKTQDQKPPPETKDTKPVELSPEELEYQRQKMLSSFGYARDPELDLPPVEEKGAG